MARSQGVGHSLLVYQRAASRVDKDAALLHLGQRLGVDEVARLLVQRAMQGDDVAHGQQTVHRGLLNALGQVGRVLARVGKDIHAEVAGYAGHALSDVAQSHDADGLACQLAEVGVPIAEVGIVAPASLAALARIVAYAVGDVQDVGKRHLGNALRAVGRNIRHHHPVARGSLHVHHVVARGQHSDIFQPRQLRKHLLVYQHLID